MNKTKNTRKNNNIKTNKKVKNKTKKIKKIIIYLLTIKVKEIINLSKK